MKGSRCTENQKWDISSGQGFSQTLMRKDHTVVAALLFIICFLGTFNPVTKKEHQPFQGLSISIHHLHGQIPTLR